jgi:hypothetical protein
LTDVSIRHSDSQEKAPAALSPCIRLYVFGKSLQELFSITSRPEYADFDALLLLMTGVKAIQIAQA